jgi:Flp pilus assembly protein TadG
MTILQRLFADKLGTMAVETALVAPVLILLGIGGFQVGDMVSQQHNLESAAALAEQIALASKPDSQAKLDMMKAAIHGSTGVPVADIGATFMYRCGTAATLQNNNSCGAEPAWMFVRITFSDTYSPPWTALGVGSNVELEVDRTVQIA